jgi:hypothetical protein
MVVLVHSIVALLIIVLITTVPFKNEIHEVKNENDKSETPDQSTFLTDILSIK